MTAPTITIPYNEFIKLMTIAGLAEGKQSIKNRDDYNKSGIVGGLEKIEKLADEIYASGVLNDKTR